MEYEANLLRAAPCPAPARNEARNPRRATPTETATACAGRRPSVRLPVSVVSRLARRPQAPARAEGGEIDFARRVFLEIKNALPVCPPVTSWIGWPRMSARRARSDSGGLAIVFASALRADGIPARVMSGRWVPDSEPGRNAADEPYVKAEFFATGVGWVPVDPGSAVNLDKSSDGLEFFGTDNADFLTMHLDTDLEFDTVFFGRKTVEFVQGPVYWVTGLRLAR